LNQPIGEYPVVPSVRIVRFPYATAVSYTEIYFFERRLFVFFLAMSSLFRFWAN